MARPKSSHVCEKCGKPGFIRKNPYSIEHFNSNTGRTNRCYVKRLIAKSEKNKRESKKSQAEQSIDILSMPVGEEHISAPLPPEYFWGESELYHKIGHLRSHFIKIAKDLSKIQKRVYHFKPQKEISLRATRHLTKFENHYLIPLEKILAPYHDLRYTCDWSDMLKIHINVIEYGLSGSSTINKTSTGLILERTDAKTGETYLVELDTKFAPSYLKKSQYRTLKFAKELIDAHPLQKALRIWDTETELVVVQASDNKEKRKSRNKSKTNAGSN